MTHSPALYWHRSRNSAHDRDILAFSNGVLFKVEPYGTGWRALADEGKGWRKEDICTSMRQAMRSCEQAMEEPRHG